MSEFKITRALAIVALAGPLFLAACGEEDDAAAVDTDADGDAAVVVTD